jgi:sec-independent protein translocase protein TatA
MGTFSIWHWLVVLAVVLILFGGGGKISRLMGDFGKGLKSFKKSLKEEDGETAESSPTTGSAPGGSSTAANAAKPALKTEQAQNVQDEPKKDKAAQG